MSDSRGHIIAIRESSLFPPSRTKKGKKKIVLPFDKDGGVIGLNRPMLESDAYLNLTAQAKCLMLLMHVHWRNDEPVAYSVSEAMRKIPCSKLTARRAFDQLEEAGFIVKVADSLFCSRLQSKSRTWRLAWLPYEFKRPTNEWKMKQPEQI